MGLTAALDRVLPDPRHPLVLIHSQLSLLRQRIYGLELGYEDLNDHTTLRNDALWQTAVDRDETLASSPTLCRLESRVILRNTRRIRWLLSSAFPHQTFFWLIAQRLSND